MSMPTPIMDFMENDESLSFFKPTTPIVQDNRSFLQETHETRPSSSSSSAMKVLLERTHCVDFSDEDIWGDDISNPHGGPNTGYDDDIDDDKNLLWPTPIDSNRIQIVESVPLEDSPSLHQDPQYNKGHIESLNDVLSHLLHGGPEEQAQPVMITPSPSVCFWSSQSQSPRKREFCMEYSICGSSHDDALLMNMGGQFEHMPSQDFKRQRLIPTDVEEHHNRDNVSPSLTGSENSSLMAVPSGHSSNTYNRHSGLWYQSYSELSKFYKKHGHCIVPPKENYTLWRWIKRQRYLYKQMHEGGKSDAISNERIALLERLGFVWDAQGTLWMDRLNELAQYRSIHGHCNVPSRYPLNHQLSTWVKCQRRQYKLYREEQAAGRGVNNKSNMTPERITALNQLGFVFDPRSEIKSTRKRKL